MFKDGVLFGGRLMLATVAGVTAAYFLLPSGTRTKERVVMWSLITTALLIVGYELQKHALATEQQPQTGGEAAPVMEATDTEESAVTKELLRQPCSETLSVEDYVLLKKLVDYRHALEPTVARDLQKKLHSLEKTVAKEEKKFSREVRQASTKLLEKLNKFAI